ncbi:hypothetical protein AYO49_00825 [Verrucomicrobiaceae bacterium SCGC AG-212-N21]|nr:hypothetical protein AYO49_00825 [Verrucomicrobiaceae bacterium SCGC AG-212-N21]
MIKAIFAGLFVFLVAGTCFFAPSQARPISAYPDNLFTSDGQWKNPSNKPTQMFKAMRTEHGWPHAWMVVDRGVEEPAWYAKRHDGLVCVYMGCSLVLGGSVFLWLARGRATRVA